MWAYVVRGRNSTQCTKVLHLGSAEAMCQPRASSRCCVRGGGSSQGEPGPVPGGRLLCSSFPPPARWLVPRGGFETPSAPAVPSPRGTQSESPVQVGAGEASLIMRQGLRSGSADRAVSRRGRSRSLQSGKLRAVGTGQVGATACSSAHAHGSSLSLQDR